MNCGTTSTIVHLFGAANLALSRFLKACCESFLPQKASSGSNEKSEHKLPPALKCTTSMNVKQTQMKENCKEFNAILHNES